MSKTNGSVVRRRELTCTEDEMNIYGDKILLADEVIRVRMGDGTIRQKIGDGVTGIGALPYIKDFDEESRSLLSANAYRTAALAENLGLATEAFEEYQAVGNGTTAVTNEMKKYALIGKIWGEFCESNVEIQPYYSYFANPPKRIAFDDLVIDLPTDLTDFGACGENYIYFSAGNAYYRQGARFESNWYGGGMEEQLADGEACITTINDAGAIIRLAEPIVTDISDKLKFDGYVDLGGVSRIEITSRFDSADDPTLSVISDGQLNDSEPWDVEVYYHVGGMLLRVAKENVPLDTEIGTVDERIASVSTIAYQNSARIAKLEKRLSAADLFSVKSVAGYNKALKLAGSEKPTAKILKLWGSYGSVGYDSTDTNDQAPDYAQYILVDGVRVFTYPKNPHITEDEYRPNTEAMEAIAPSFGYDEDNYIYTEGDKWYYRQAGRYHQGYYMGKDEVSLADDEASCKWYAYKGGAFNLLKEPIVTDITDRMNGQSPYITVEGAGTVRLWNAHKPMTVTTDSETYYLTSGTAGAQFLFEY